MKRPQAAKRQPRNGEVQISKRKLEGNEQANQHADNAPEHGGRNKETDDPIIVAKRVLWGTHSSIYLLKTLA